jgi:ornithine carbamoyltransferase
MVRHFLTDLDVSADEQMAVLDLALAMKKDPSHYRNILANKILGMIFQKSSTRTRVSFEAGIIQLGGQAIFLSHKDVQIGRGEPVKDTGGVLSRYLDILMIRTFSHTVVEELARASSVPVINGLDDRVHPCQGLADLLTIYEHKKILQGLHLAYVGDGNNMAHSLLLAGTLAGMQVTIVTPPGYAPLPEIVEQARSLSEVRVTTDLSGVEGADAVYTDVWASMGQEEEADARIPVFAPYQVNTAVMRRAKPDALFMHCMPAHRGEEVSAEVIDGPQAVVLDQAENRLHVQKALMAFLLQKAP